MDHSRDGLAWPASHTLCARICVWVAVAGVVTVLAACRRPPPPDTARILAERRPPSWFEHVADAARVSPDGRWALYGSGTRLSLVELASGAADEATLRGPFASVDGATFDAESRLIRRATVDGKAGWYRERQPLAIDARHWPVWSPDGTRLATFDTGSRQAGLLVDGRRYAIDAHLLNLAWTPDRQTIVTLTRTPDYAVSVGRLDLTTGQHRFVREHLDGDVYPAQIAVTTVDKALVALVSLVSPIMPSAAERHDPLARRDLDIWRVDLADGTPTLHARTDGDDVAAGVAGRHLVWTQACIAPSVVVLPAGGGAARVLVDRAELPYWNHTGRQVGFTVGGWRLRDVALPLDVHTVAVDAEARAVAPPRPLIEGFHEDFTPAWSPDGQWLAFHSHRSAAPVVSYAAPGSTDDLWVARSSDPGGSERRLTDFGHEAGMGDWSPDGRRLAFVSHQRGGPPGLVTWLLDFDPARGVTTRAERLRLPKGVRSTETLAWSPDGRWLAVESKTDKPDVHALWVIAVDTGTGRRLAEYRSATFGGVDWMPDGRTLVHGTLLGDRMQIAATDVASGSTRPLTDEATASLFLPQVSPDGRWIAATAMRHTRRLVRAPLDGRGAAAVSHVSCPAPPTP